MENITRIFPLTIHTPEKLRHIFKYFCKIEDRYALSSKSQNGENKYTLIIKIKEVREICQTRSFFVTKKFHGGGKRYDTHYGTPRMLDSDKNGQKIESRLREAADVGHCDGNRLSPAESERFVASLHKPAPALFINCSSSTLRLSFQLTLSYKDISPISNMHR